MKVRELTVDEWRGVLPERGVSVFHSPEALQVLDDHDPGTMRLFGGFKGEEPIALLPVFVRSNPVGRAVLSPPPDRNVPHLGPVLMPASPKRRKKEQVNRRFTEQVLEACDIGTSRTLFRMICSTAYADPRPYSWADLSVDTMFTYVLPVGSRTPDDLMGSFSSSLAREIRAGQDLDIRIEVESVRAIPAIHQATRARFEELDDPSPLTAEYVRDVVAALESRARVYVARTTDGTFLNGIVVLYSNDTAYFWFGGTRTTYEDVSINGLLHWRIITDIVESPSLGSISKYDLVGANIERLCRYKAKFGATLVPYYVVESTGVGMHLAKRAYELAPNGDGLFQRWAVRKYWQRSRTRGDDRSTSEAGGPEP